MQKETVNSNGNLNKKQKPYLYKNNFKSSIYHLRTFVGKYSLMSSM